MNIIFLLRQSNIREINIFVYRAIRLMLQNNCIVKNKAFQTLRLSRNKLLQISKNFQSAFNFLEKWCQKKYMRLITMLFHYSNLLLVFNFGCRSEELQLYKQSAASSLLTVTLMCSVKKSLNTSSSSPILSIVSSVMWFSYRHQTKLMLVHE
jgi:hypothetical protein